MIGEMILTYKKISLVLICKNDLHKTNAIIFYIFNFFVSIICNSFPILLTALKYLFLLHIPAIGSQMQAETIPLVSAADLFCVWMQRVVNLLLSSEQTSSILEYKYLDT